MTGPETKILVIDDMVAMRMRVMNQLKAMGFTKIEQAGDGKEAYELIVRRRSEENPFDLVISDWNMPVMTGIELLEKIRSDKDLKAMPFVMVTAEGEKLQVVRALKAGVTDYLIKPVNKEDLEKKLAALSFSAKAAA